jgi:hypothetical protein
MIRCFTLISFFVLASITLLLAQPVDRSLKFKQLYEELPTPTTYRTASGAPGHHYYQQRADYVMTIRLDDQSQRIYGEQTVTYHNNSPDELTYLWVQLDQNMRARDSQTPLIRQESLNSRVAFSQLKNLVYDFDGGFKLEYVRTTDGKDLPFIVNYTMMRIDLPQPLKPGQRFSFTTKWWYNVNDRMAVGGRSGYEYFEKDKNYLYTIAQFFPKNVCVQ